MGTRLMPDKFEPELDPSDLKRIHNRGLFSYISWRMVWHELDRIIKFRDAVTDSPARLNPLVAILAAFGFERGRQIEKWGDQTHPCVPAELPGIPHGHAVGLRSIAQELEIAAKADCNNAFREGNGTWWHIAWEELAEAGAAPPEKRREELVQLGAVIVAWIEDLDARTEQKDSKP